MSKKPSKPSGRGGQTPTKPIKPPTPRPVVIQRRPIRQPGR